MVIVQRIPSNIRPMKKRCSCSLPRVLLSDSTETHPFNSLLCTSHKEVSGLAPTGTPGPTPASAQRPTAPKDHGPMAPQHTTPILTNLIPYTLLSPLVSSQSAPAFGRGVGTPLYSHASLCAYPRSWTRWTVSFRTFLNSFDSFDYLRIPSLIASTFLRSSTCCHLDVKL